MLCYVIIFIEIEEIRPDAWPGLIHLLCVCIGADSVDSTDLADSPFSVTAVFGAGADGAAGAVFRDTGTQLPVMLVLRLVLS